MGRRKHSMSPPLDDRDIGRTEMAATHERHFVILPSLCYYCANNGAHIEKKVGSKILLICKKCYTKDDPGSVGMAALL